MPFGTNGFRRYRGHPCCAAGTPDEMRRFAGVWEGETKRLYEVWIMALRSACATVKRNPQLRGAELRKKIMEDA